MPFSTHNSPCQEVITAEMSVSWEHGVHNPETEKGEC